ncbi:hypothetical protein ANO14919_003380 [Xylariales sp. No.14919]|nr:hypothetical protein ANO14919_003380 [Xylariales sp. No.14919]
MWLYRVLTAFGARGAAQARVYPRGTITRSPWANLRILHKIGIAERQSEARYNRRVIRPIAVKGPSWSIQNG